MKQYHGKKSKIKNIKVPQNVKKNAQIFFKLKNLGFKGAIDTGNKRAKQLATKEEISIEDLRYMHAWYARHYYTSYPTYKKWKENNKPKTKEWHNKRGIQAWLSWGGDAGYNWNIHIFNQNTKKIKYLIQPGVLDWVYNLDSKIEKDQENEWGKQIVKQIEQREVKNNWTTIFCETILSEILELRNENPRKIKRTIKDQDNMKYIVPDFESDQFIYECKGRTYCTGGTAGEKILATPYKYSECRRLFKKDLKIVVMGYQEYEADKVFNLFNTVSVEKKKILDTFKDIGIQYVKTTSLLNEWVEQITRKK